MEGIARVAGGPARAVLTALHPPRRGVIGAAPQFFHGDHDHYIDWVNDTGAYLGEPIHLRPGLHPVEQRFCRHTLNNDEWRRRKCLFHCGNAQRISTAPNPDGRSTMPAMPAPAGRTTSNCSGDQRGALILLQ